MVQTTPPTEWETPAEAAERLKSHERTVRRRIASGELPGYRFGPRKILVKKADVDALLERIPAGDRLAG